MNNEREALEEAVQEHLKSKTGNCLLVSSLSGVKRNNELNKVVYGEDSSGLCLFGELIIEFISITDNTTKNEFSDDIKMALRCYCGRDVVFVIRNAHLASFDLYRTISCHGGYRNGYIRFILLGQGINMSADRSFNLGGDDVVNYCDIDNTLSLKQSGFVVEIKELIDNGVLDAAFSKLELDKAIGKNTMMTPSQLVFKYALTKIGDKYSLGHPLFIKKITQEHELRTILSNTKGNTQ